MKPFVRVQLGMILGFITLGLLVIEFIIFLRKVETVLFPKQEMTASIPQKNAVPYQPPIYAQESIEKDKYIPNFCPHCGYKIVDQKAKFCSSCGGKLMD
jgi:DNA-directed RNA polymerase subunit RPC12/RpoP